MVNDGNRTRAWSRAKSEPLGAREALPFTARLRGPGAPTCLPEISLVAAIFEDAVRCVQRASRGVTPEQSAEAAGWMASERRDWPFAFVNVCDFLGVDAISVRRQLGVGIGPAAVG